MGLLKRLFGAGSDSSDTTSESQAVLVHLDGTGLPDELYEEHDLATLEDRLVELVEQQNLGEFDGNESGPTETTLYLYGPDAERLFSGIESAVRAYPLCQGARVVIRKGAPGAEQRIVQL